ncbi:MAG: TIGR04222 domain-containing membrane protein, partial [Lysobacter sp.]|nr:TIGR04222 domain-containing membrane protein [Lysobacter sp.]
NPDGGKPPLPESLREAMWIVQRRQNLDDALGALKQHYAGLGEHLQRKGWWMSSGRALCARLMGTLPIVALIGFGLGKIFIGVERGKPVGFLVVLTAFAGVLALVRWAYAKRRSRAGDWALHDADRALAKRRESSDAEAGARVALMGTAGLLDSALVDYHTLRTPVSSSSDGSGGSSSCGSSGNSGGSSDSGGSSCGSSGCGGCGGGGD